jgi:flavin reductase (DIM6/NTAB) family NADH-FMN oxidoreductase RutF
MFVKTDPEKIKDNVFKLISKDWLLVTAGEINNYNMMTASWGALGHLWNKNICIAFVRPQRYTYDFMEKYDYFTFSFYSEKYRDMLKFCGTKSGRAFNKTEECGLTPIESFNKSIYFNEADLVFECKKLYYDDLKENNFLIDSLQKEIYPKKDFHRLYIGEITNTLLRDK